MRIASIELEGFRSWRTRQRVDLEGVDMVAVVGANRAGKTSLIAAVEFALWGSTRGTSVLDVINRSAAKAVVTLEFVNDEGRFRITRTRTRSGRHEVRVCAADPSLPGGWRELCEPSASAADPLIVRIVGMDERTSALTWLVRQNEYDAFFRMPATDRRASLVAAFGLDRFQRLADAAEEERRAAADLAQHAQWRVDEAARALQAARDFLDGNSREEAERAARGAELALEEAERALVQAEVSGGEADRLVAAHRDALAAVNARRSELAARRDEAAGRRADAQRRADLVRRANAEAPTLAAAVDGARAEVARIEQGVEGLAGQQVEVQKNLASIEAALAGLRGARADLDVRVAALSRAGAGCCTVCGSSLDQARAAQLAVQAEREAVQVDAQVAQLSSDLSFARNAGAELAARQQRAASRLGQARRAADDAAARAAENRAACAAGGQVFDDVARFTAEAERADAELRSLADPVLDVARVEQLRAAGSADVAQLKAARDRARAVRDGAALLLADVSRAVSDMAAAAGRVKEAAGERDGHAQRADDLRVVRDEFRPAGIPSRILDGIVAELNEDANAIMDATGDDGLRIEVSTTRETRSGSAQDRVTVYAVTPDGARVEWSTLSGSEQFRLAVAFRLGEARCVARRTGTPVRTFVLDEGWGNLDEVTRRAVAGVLARLAADFGVLTVSHVDDVKERFDDLVVVDAATGTSRAAVVHR